MTLLVGEARLPKNIGRYCESFQALEVDCEPGKVPGKSRLASVRQQAGERLRFSLVLPALLPLMEESPNAQAEWTRVERLADLLHPAYWVVRSPAELRPTSANRARLQTLFARLKKHAAQPVWEAGGVWDDREAARFAADQEVVLVQDVSQQEPVPAPTLYCRIRALGRGAHVGLGLAEKIVERAAQFERSIVIVEGKGAMNVVKAAQGYGLLPPPGDEETTLASDEELA